MKIPPFQLERYFAKYEFNAPYILCASDCESLSIRELLSQFPLVIEDFQKQWLGYTESLGNPELRSEIAQLYNKVTAQDILVHTGAEEAIFIFMNAVLEKGDHVIVHYPCYQSLFEIARAIGCEVTKWETNEESDWELDLDFLKHAIRENTRAIIINCPHNPTGYLMSRDKLNEIIDLARAQGLILFSDEVYRFLEYNEEDRLPAACDIYENAVSLGVMSKAFGLAGLRIGWIATENEAIYRDMAGFKDYTSICNSAPSEFLAIQALLQKDKILSRNLGIISANLRALDGFFSRHQALFNWKAPKAGAIAFPSINMDIHVEEFCKKLVKDKGVLLLPSNYYDFWNRNFRIGFGRSNLPDCIDRLEEFVEENF